MGTRSSGYIAFIRRHWFIHGCVAYSALGIIAILALEFLKQEKRDQLEERFGSKLRTYTLASQRGVAVPGLRGQILPLVAGPIGGRFKIDTKLWYELPYGARANSPEDVDIVARFYFTEEVVGFYYGAGVSAKRVDCLVEIIKVPEGTIIDERSFLGSAPPNEIYYTERSRPRSDQGVGIEPTSEAIEWVVNSYAPVSSRRWFRVRRIAHSSAVVTWVAAMAVSFFGYARVAKDIPVRSPVYRERKATSRTTFVLALILLPVVYSIIIYYLWMII